MRIKKPAIGDAVVVTIATSPALLQKPATICGVYDERPLDRVDVEVELDENDRELLGSAEERIVLKERRYSERTIAGGWCYATPDGYIEV